MYGLCDGAEKRLTGGEGTCPGPEKDKIEWMCHLDREQDLEVGHHSTDSVSKRTEKPNHKMKVLV